MTLIHFNWLFKQLRLKWPATTIADRENKINVTYFARRQTPHVTNFHCFRCCRLTLNRNAKSSDGYGVQCECVGASHENNNTNNNNSPQMLLSCGWDQHRCGLGEFLWSSESGLSGCQCAVYWKNQHSQRTSGGKRSVNCFPFEVRSLETCLRSIRWLGAYYAWASRADDGCAL